MNHVTPPPPPPPHEFTCDPLRERRPPGVKLQVRLNTRPGVHMAREDARWMAMCPRAANPERDGEARRPSIEGRRHIHDGCGDTAGTARPLELHRNQAWSRSELAASRDGCAPTNREQGCCGGVLETAVPSRPGTGGRDGVSHRGGGIGNRGGGIRRGASRRIQGPRFRRRVRVRAVGVGVIRRVLASAGDAQEQDENSRPTHVTSHIERSSGGLKVRATAEQTARLPAANSPDAASVVD